MGSPGPESHGVLHTNNPAHCVAERPWWLVIVGQLVDCLAAAVGSKILTDGWPELEQMVFGDPPHIRKKFIL